jgi:hypothetical protein
MSPDLARIADGKKFMWDGETYDSREQAVRAAESYKGENFETEIEEDEGKFLVYSRRVVKEVVAATQ